MECLPSPSFFGGSVLRQRFAYRRLHLCYADMLIRPRVRGGLVHLVRAIVRQLPP